MDEVGDGCFRRQAEDRNVFGHGAGKGKPPELIDQVKDGVVDIAWTVVGYSPGRFPRTEVFELPFMMTNAEATSKAYWDIFESDMKDQDFKDYHIIGTRAHGPGVIHAKGEGVHKLEDMKGLKLRGPSRMTNALIKEMGAEPIGLPVPAIPEALSKGVIDGTVIPWEVTGALKVAELTKYAYRVCWRQGHLHCHLRARDEQAEI
ncbi:MAG: TRAP transporter substrate-binding protein DctP [Nitratireductor sp.]